MAILTRYPEGSDITILDTSYTYPRKDPDTGQYKKDFMIVTAKDNVTGKKFHETIYEPKYRFYKTKPEVSTSHNRFFIEKEKVEPVECKFSDLTKTIAELTDNLDFYYDNIKTGNRRANKQLHWIPSIFSSDANIEDHYRARFGQDYINDTHPITKGYFDIEVDTIDMKGDFPYPGECPINAISYIDDISKSINIFLLRDNNNPLIEEFESNFKHPLTREALFAELQSFITENVGGEDKLKKFGLEGYSFNFNFFDIEIQLIIALFNLININQPDFLLAWNMAFDIPYIIERIYALGYNPADIMCHPDFEEKIAEYFIDEQHRNEYDQRGDYYKISAYTVYIDQLIQFASRRKGQAAFPNFKLDTAADIITKGAVRKLDYSHITTNLTKLPYLDYKTFVFYNIMDTVAQKCIESTVNDIDYIYNICTLNDTRYSKGHRQTIYLVNQARKYFYNKGYILGNNTNSGESESFAGALVGDPTKNSDYSKMKQNGETYNLMNNLDDFDYKALYPSIDIWHNMAPNTQKGKIFIDDEVHELENPYNDDKYDRGGQFLEDLCTGNILEFSVRWLGLGRIRDVLDDMEQYFAMHPPLTDMDIFRNDAIKPMSFYPESDGIKPMHYLQEDELIKPFAYNRQIDAQETIRRYNYECS